jgi:hypothetical protein
MRAARVFAAAALAVLTLTSLIGCPQRVSIPELEGLTAETARRRIEIDGQRRERMSGLVKARLDGIEGLFASADIDVLVEQPARLHLAVRSFFEQPMLVLATDGVFLTILDSTQETGPVFYRGVVDGRAFARVLPLEVWPSELVALFLGVAPVAGSQASQLIIDDKARTYAIGLREPNGRASVITARADDDALVRWQSYDASGTLLFDARYEDHVEQDGIAFAKTLRLSLPSEGETERTVRFEAKEVEFNGAPFDARAFALEPPPGMPVRPLPGS